MHARSLVPAGFRSGRRPGCRLPQIARLRDRSTPARPGTLTVHVIDAEITMLTDTDAKLPRSLIREGTVLSPPGAKP